MRFGAAPLLAALLVGCSRGPSGAVIVESFADLQPDANPGESAILRLGDPATPMAGSAKIPVTEFEVRTVYAKNGNELTIELRTEGETVEKEVYETSGESFKILAATDDSFVPGIDLIRFPARSDETWDWAGKVVYAGSSRSAVAKIVLREEGSKITSEVQLQIAADPGHDLTRTLKFWFEKDKGVVRRSFGSVSSRRPSGEAWQP